MITYNIIKRLKKTSVRVSIMIDHTLKAIFWPTAGGAASKGKIV